MLPHKQLPRQACLHSSTAPYSSRIAAGAASRLRRSQRCVTQATTQQQQVGESLQQSQAEDLQSPTTSSVQTTEGDAANAVVAHFNVKGKVAFGEWLRLVGSSEEFGRWGPFKGPLLKWHEGDNWKASIKLPCGECLEFKVVVCHEQGGSPGWEQGPNRVLQVPSEPGVLEHSCDLGKIDSGRGTFYPYIGPQQNGSTDGKQARAPSSSPSTNGKPSPQQLAYASQQQSNPSASQASGSSASQGSSPSSAGQSQAVSELYSLLGSAAISAAAGAGCLLILALNEAATENKQRVEARRAEAAQAELLSSFDSFPSSSFSFSSFSDPIDAPPLQDFQW